jgi:hypothetical protein
VKPCGAFVEAVGDAAEISGGASASVPAGRGKEISFAIDQLGLDETAKALVADWTVQNFPLYNGAGVVIDAGSTCFKLWCNMRDEIVRGGLAHIRVLTGSYLVLQDAVSHTEPELQSTTVDIIGETFDRSHRAFYLRKHGGVGQFRPSMVYIGASSIEFDVRAGILLGYHGDGERISKEMLFRYPCKARVILTTARKIGVVGVEAFNILEPPSSPEAAAGQFSEAPIYIVTTEPEKAAEVRLFERSRDTFLSTKMQDTVGKLGMEVHWVTINRQGELAEDLVAPMRVDSAGSAQV